MENDDVVTKLVGALLDVVPVTVEAQQEVLELQRDWLIFVLDTLSACLPSNEEGYGIVRAAQSVIPDDVYEQAVNRFWGEDKA